MTRVAPTRTLPCAQPAPRSCAIDLAVGVVEDETAESRTRSLPSGDGARGPVNRLDARATAPGARIAAAHHRQTFPITASSRHHASRRT